MKTSTMKLGDLLTKNDPAFFIPPYQRKYEWTEEQCAVLLNDALKILASDPKEAPWHFFGTALLSVSEESSISDVRYVLIDGQQRLTTVFLFLAACRDGGSCPRSLAKRIASILFRSGFSRLEQSETDRGEYLKILSSPSSLEDGGRLWENYLFFRREISGLSGSQPCLQDLAETVLERFQMVVLEPERRDGALQDIFESMNSVGIPLSFADLAGNWLLMLPDSSAQKELFSSCWIPMEEALESGNNKDASDFIRSYMEMKACKSYLKPPFFGQPKPCYFEFKRIFSNSPKAALLEDLRIHASLYSQLKTAQTPNTQANSTLQNLNAARAEAATPFLLLLFSVRQKGLLSDPDLLKILGAVRTYFLRRRLRGLPSGGAECDFANLSGRIGELLKAKDKEEAAFARLSSQPKGLWLPNDAELAERLKNKAFCSNNPKMQKFFLSLVEGEISRSHLNPEDPNLTIEHIMPQSLTQKRIEDLGEGADDAHSKLLDNIGNLAILPSDLNVQAGNKSFKEKKKIYVSQGGLQMTRSYMTDRDKWDEGAILRRGERITEIFLRSILPLPPKYRNAQNFAA
ncbi:MAG: DUF262 domain-containing protein [Aeriscardovia sp.]|nr:DUF262 domain-containing protein [Aeriscardovia sp.]